MSEVVCTYCGRPVDPQSRETWQRVVGWSRPGKSGGSDIACREPHPRVRFACDPCVRMVQSGLSPHQGTLV